MNLYKRLVWPVLSQTDPESIHEQTLTALELAQRTSIGRYSLRQIRGAVPSTAISCFGLTFPNVVGIAAGFDKDVRVAAGLAELGFGHIEVGTLTPRPQKGNPKPRIFRLKQDGALINRMGFPNGGVTDALPRLRQLAYSHRNFVIGVSLGKQKETPLDDAVEDYLLVMQQVWAYADYLAVNISSPNTPGLRKLQGEAYLNQMLQRLREENERLAEQAQRVPKPLLLKIAPDITWAELDAILQAALDQKMAGMIATNTTIMRDGLLSKHKDEKGGLSGLPVRERSTQVVHYITHQTKLPTIGVGGIRTAADVRAKLDAGASLVQLYTGLVYEGPGMAGRLLRGL